jgi:hypothetical protein
MTTLFKTERRLDDIGAEGGKKIFRKIFLSFFSSNLCVSGAEKLVKFRSCNMKNAQNVFPVDWEAGKPVLQVVSRIGSQRIF